MRSRQRSRSASAVKRAAAQAGGESRKCVLPSPSRQSHCSGCPIAAGSLEERPRPGQHGERDQIGRHLHDVGADRHAETLQAATRTPPPRRTPGRPPPRAHGFQRADDQRGEREIAAPAGHAVGEGADLLQRQHRPAEPGDRAAGDDREHAHAQRVDPRGKDRLRVFAGRAQRQPGLGAAEEQRRARRSRAPRDR